jgi:hypothetical protein
LRIGEVTGESEPDDLMSLEEIAQADYLSALVDRACRGIAVVGIVPQREFAQFFNLVRRNGFGANTQEGQPSLAAPVVNIHCELAEATGIGIAVASSGRLCPPCRSARLTEAALGDCGPRRYASPRLLTARS